MTDAGASTDRQGPDPGLGLFETLLVRDGRVQALDQHLSRLSASVDACYGLALPGDLEGRVRSEVRRLTGTHRLRVSAIGGTIEIDSEPADVSPAPEPDSLVAVLLPGGLGPHKWCDRRWLQGLSSDGSVPLLLDDGGEILEAARANVWILEGRSIATPPADGRILPGVTRELVLGLAGDVGLRAGTETISLERARRADGIFLTSSVRLAAGAVLAGAQPSSRATSTVGRIRGALEQICWTPVTD